MRWLKWTGIGAAILLIAACFMKWVYIVSKNITVTGVQATGTLFGKPGYFHLLMIVFFIPFALIPRLWAKRANLVVAALNLAWAFRNYIVIPGCSGGECPEKHAGLYLALLSSVIMLVSALFPDIREPQIRQ